ncbi:ankyrin repeat domain-containing protein [Brachyspira hyodysenteriae]|uniref:ankyrin repeat domain-containing protein n=1 Tax=Brachyspira hyodysenteriae TaxID=159 RepID=UPI00118283E8|nr:ankyrin repeat domain-containing protein [Brachyspira hyodysenteriae]TVL83447.1 hypothetical protein A9X82_11590 [Brachyspira hyodysenteriae]
MLIYIKESKYDYTVLMEASSKLHIKIVNILLEYNADTSIEDIYGFTALYYALESGNSNIINMLENR